MSESDECQKCGAKACGYMSTSSGQVACAWECESRLFISPGILSQSDACRIRELTNTVAQQAEEIAALTEAVKEDRTKWSFDALLFMAERLLSENYPPEFTAAFADCPGSRLADALRAAVAECRAATIAYRTQAGA